MKFYKCHILFFWRNQKNIARIEVIIITVSEEIEISREAFASYQFDKTEFFTLAMPPLFVACFLTLHLTEIYQVQGLLSVMLISFYFLFIYLIYTISNLIIDKQNKNLKKLGEMIIVDYKTCRFCGKQLSIKEFYDSNKNVDLQKISKIWNYDFYGLLCCNCFANTPSKFWIKFKAIK
ncbi:MAG: hypothetical protein ACTSQU_04250 [Promethearchaeota archaeon]